MNIDNEFSTVDLIITSDFETRGVDGFILSLIKVEKQIRRIFTFLVFQHPLLSNNDVSKLRKTLAENKQMYFENFIIGIDQVYSKSLKEIYGDSYDTDLAKIKEIVSDRNKIFHGQITQKGLTRQDLLDRIKILRNWAKNIETKFNEEIGYNGFSNSYQKTQKKIDLKNVDTFSSIDNYRILLISIDRSRK